MRKTFVIAALAAGMAFSAPLAAQASAGVLGVNIKANAAAKVENVDFRRDRRENRYDRRDDRRRERFHRREERREHRRYERRENRRGYYYRPAQRPYYRPFSHWRPRYAHRFHRWGRPAYYAHYRGWGPAYRVHAYDRARDRAVILWISAVTGAILLSQY